MAARSLLANQDKATGARARKVDKRSRGADSPSGGPYSHSRRLWGTGSSTRIMNGTKAPDSNVRSGCVDREKSTPDNNQCIVRLPQHCLYFLPDPHGQGSLRLIFVVVRRYVPLSLVKPAAMRRRGAK
jgi:hypothetical protein